MTIKKNQKKIPSEKATRISRQRGKRTRDVIHVVQCGFEPWGANIKMWLFGQILLLAVSTCFGRSIRHLLCNSVNRVLDEEEINFVFISSKSADCTFLFEGPTHSQLEMKVHSLSDGNYITGSSICTNKSRFKLYDSRIDKFVEMSERICSDKDDTTVVTESNMGIVRSQVGDGSFFVRVKTQAKRGIADNLGVVGMNPPVQHSEDFFRASEFAAEWKPESFRPSLGVPGYKPLSTSYGVPVPEPEQPKPYPGKPGQIVELTSAKPETTKINETITTPQSTTTITISSQPTSPTTIRPISTTKSTSTTTEEF